MIPAGPERDRIIAELKYGNASMALDGKTVLVNEEPDEHGHYGSFESPKFSTDIACAMELELPGGNCDILIFREPGECEQFTAFIRAYFYPKTFEFKSSVHLTQAEAIADARSGAWLNYKKEQS